MKNTLSMLRVQKVAKCLPELKKLSKIKSEEKRIILIHKAKTCVIDAISEIALNCLRGRIPLKSCEFSALKKYQTILRTLSNISPVIKRKRLLIQSGGFLSVILPPAISFLSSILGSYLSKKFRK